MKFLIVFLLMFSTFSAECVNSSLKKAGFGFANKKTFSQIEINVNKWILESSEDFVLDYESELFSSIYNDFVSITSIDNLQTSEDEMDGDVIFIRALSSGKLLEIRWFQNGLKSVAFDKDYQKCPTAIVPTSSNKLF